MNATMEKFGAPDTIIRDYAHWVVQLRPQQATLGALVLICKGPARAFGQIGPDAFGELHRVTGELETALHAAFAYEKLNYLMLMMVDPDVHFHVLPRYHDVCEFAGCRFADPGWPGPPDLTAVNPSDARLNASIRARILAHWP